MLVKPKSTVRNVQPEIFRLKLREYTCRSRLLVLIVIVSTLTSCSASGEHTQDALRSAREELDHSRLADAQALALLAVKDCRTWGPQLDSEQYKIKDETLQMLEALARKNRDMGRFETAKSLYDQAVQLNEIGGPSAEHKRLLIEAMAHLEDSEKLEVSLIHKAKSKSDTCSPEFWKQFSAIDELKKKKHFYEAEREAKKLCKQSTSADKDAIFAEYWNAVDLLAGIYIDQGKIEEAIEVYQQVCNDYAPSKQHSRFSEFDDARIRAHGLVQQAKLLAKKKETLPKAESPAREALALCRVHHNEQSPEFADSIVVLIDVLKKLHNHNDEVVRLTLEVLGLAKKGQMSGELTLIHLASLADSLYASQQYAEAAGLYDHVISHSENADLVTPELLSLAALSNIAIQNKTRAEELQQLSLAKAKEKKRSNEVIGAIIYEWALAEHQQHDTELALKWYRKAATLLTPATNEFFRDKYALCIAGIGQALFDQGNRLEAERKLRSALELWKGNKTSIGKAGTLNNLSALLLNDGRKTAALQANQEALEICKSQLGELAEPTVSTRLQIAYVLYSCGENQKALEMARTAEQNATRSGGAVNARNAVTARLLEARALFLLGKKKEATQTALSAIKSCDKVVTAIPTVNNVLLKKYMFEALSAIDMPVESERIYKDTIAESIRLHLPTKSLEDEWAQISK